MSEAGPKAPKFRIPIKTLRWVLLNLYVLVVMGVLGLWVQGSSANDLWQPFVVTIIFVASQAFFIGSAGTVEMCKPVHRRRLLLPVIVAATMMTVLVAGMTMALGELLKVNGGAQEMFWAIVALSWVVWTALFFVHTRDLERFAAVRRMVLWLLSGSLLTLLVTIPSHIVVSRRGGCLVGLCTMLGIISGCIVMFWSFGPGIILLYLRDRRDWERAQAENPMAKKPQ